MVGRRNTGLWSSSESANASRIIWYASATPDGSRHGTLLNWANVRVSCSVCDEMGPGSSATTMTMPPLTPMYSRLMRGSAATFRPTHFMVTSERAPAYDAPAATSSAAFSFTDHSTYTSPGLRFATVSMISVEGVPGYPATTSTPAASAPSAIASFPIRNSLCMGKPPPPAAPAARGHASAHNKLLTTLQKERRGRAASWQTFESVNRARGRARQGTPDERGMRSSSHWRRADALKNRTSRCATMCGEPFQAN